MRRCSIIPSIMAVAALLLSPSPSLAGPIYTPINDGLSHVVTSGDGAGTDPFDDVPIFVVDALSGIVDAIDTSGQAYSFTFEREASASLLLTVRVLDTSRTPPDPQPTARALSNGTSRTQRVEHSALLA